MSSLSFRTNRKRQHSPDYGDDSDFEDDELPPFKLRRKNFPVTVTSKLRSFAIWITQIPVKTFFTMALKSGSAVAQDTIIIDSENDKNESEELEYIQKIKDDYNMEKVASLFRKSLHENDSRHSKHQSEVNGSYSLNSHYGGYRNGSRSIDWNSRFHRNGNYSPRQSDNPSPGQNNDLKRPAIISNPPTDIEILLDSEREVSTPEADGIEILSESHNPKQKHVHSQKPVRLSRSSAIKHSVMSQSRNHISSVNKLQSSSKAFTANEVVRLQEKAQYKLLLEKFITGSYYYPVAKKSQCDAGVQADTNIISGSHFKKEVLQQPVDNFFEKYYVPCRLLSSEKNTLNEKKKEPTEIKIDDDDNEDDDDVQIVGVKLPQYKSKYNAPSFTNEWFYEMKCNLRAVTEERLKIVEDQERLLEKYKKERLLNRLRVEGPASQAVEPEFPELTPEMEEEIDKALTGPPEEQLCKITSDFLLRKDIETLSGLKWLNDLVINSYFDLIVERNKQEGFPSIHAYNTFFYSTYKTKGYVSVRRWTRKLDIFGFDLNFVPIHLGVHWCLAVIDHRSKKICYYDSMGTGEEQCLDLLHEYLCLEYKDKKGQILDPSIYTTEVMKDIPQQMNGSDCGMFTLKYAEYISRDAEITFNQDHMQYFRRRMVYELLKKQLL